MEFVGYYSWNALVSIERLEEFVLLSQSIMTRSILLHRKSLDPLLPWDLQQQSPNRCFRMLSSAGFLCFYTQLPPVLRSSCLIWFKLIVLDIVQVVNIRYCLPPDVVNEGAKWRHLTSCLWAERSCDEIMLWVLTLSRSGCCTLINCGRQERLGTQNVKKINSSRLSIDIIQNLDCWAFRSAMTDIVELELHPLGFRL